MAPGRGGGPLPEPGCCSLLPGAQNHPFGKAGRNPGFSERGGAQTIRARAPPDRAVEKAESHRDPAPAALRANGEEVQKNAN